MQEAADARAADALLPDERASRAADERAPRGDCEGPAADECDPFDGLDEYLDSVQAEEVQQPPEDGNEQMAAPQMDG
eukprot:729264-Pyramimonas_sp.AAC.1